MGNAGGGGVICSREWLAAPPLVLLPRQEVTELLKRVWQEVTPLRPGASSCGGRGGGFGGREVGRREIPVETRTSPRGRAS
jgi:hypothetical protein